MHLQLLDCYVLDCDILRYFRLVILWIFLIVYEWYRLIKIFEAHGILTLKIRFRSEVIAICFDHLHRIVACPFKVLKLAHVVK